VPKVQTQTNKKIKVKVQKKGAKETEENPGLAHRTVRCTRDDRLKLFNFGFLESRSAMIHRTVRWATGLSGVPAEQRLRSATVDSNGCLQREQCADSSRRVRAVPKGAPDSEQCLSSATPDCPVPQDVRAPMVETIRTLTVG
jgi:hypothetical protein